MEISEVELKDNENRKNLIKDFSGKSARFKYKYKSVRRRCISKIHETRRHKEKGNGKITPACDFGVE